MTFSEEEAEITALSPYRRSSNDQSSKNDYSRRIYGESKKRSSDEYEVLEDDSPEVSDIIIHHTYEEHMVVDKQKFSPNIVSSHENDGKLQHICAEHMDFDEPTYCSTDDISHSNVDEIQHVYAEDLEKAKFYPTTDRNEDDDGGINHTYAEHLDLETRKYYSINESRETVYRCNKENNYLQIED